jgi:hypothetical protein
MDDRMIQEQREAIAMQQRLLHQQQLIKYCPLSLSHRRPSHCM